MEYNIKVDRITNTNGMLGISINGWAQAVSEVAHPKVMVHFFDTVTGEDRRLPIVMQNSYVNQGKCYFTASCQFNLPYLFYKKRYSYNLVEMYVNVLFEDYYEEKIQIDLEPEEYVEETPQFDVKICGNHLELKRNGAKITKLMSEVGFFGSLYTWLWFIIGCLFLPLFFIDGLMAEAGVVPYKTSRVNDDRSMLRRIVRHMNACMNSFTRHEINFVGIKIEILRWLYTFYRIGGVNNKQIALVSVRRNDLSGNMEFVYNKLKEDPTIKVKTFLCDKEFAHMSFGDLVGIARACGRSKLIAVDEYTFFIYQINLSPKTKVMQLWHACGAFKTFGYTRLGQTGGTKQNSPTHRNYDYATVSSENIRIWYAEAFGVPTDHIVATGIPRTDIFFDPVYKEKTRERLYKEYPMLQGKKVILFSPTFRGATRLKAGYPMDRFDVGHLLDNISDEYMLIIKHHPFVTESHPVPERYKDRVLDLSASSELNDLLFITDIAITDYSSMVFEASLLDIPMLFYTFDLKEYIRERDFYFNFETFVPGRFFYQQEEMEEAIRSENFEKEKVKAFAEKFFDMRDGRSTERVVELMKKALGMLAGAILLTAVALAPTRVKAETFTIRPENNTDITEELNQALEDAAAISTNDDIARVVVPAGEYSISGMLHIYSNTTLDLSAGVTITAADNGNRFNMLLAGTNEAYDGYEDYNNEEGCAGYKGFENITIKGGTWRGCANNGAVLMRIAHAKNVKLSNVTIEGGGGAHQMEVAAINGFTVEGCTFENFGNGYVEGKRMEALQLDVVCDNQAFPDYYQDGTPLKNVSISNCTFSKVPRGIGGHNVLMGSYFDKVTVKNCTFKDIDEEAIACLNWKNSTINSNEFRNCGAGILFQYYKVDGTTNQYVTVFDGTEAFNGTIDSNANTSISDNTITTKYTGTKYEVQAIKVYGFDNSNGSATGRYGKALARVDYAVSGLTIENNTISTAGYGIHLYDTENSVISRNEITQEKVSDADSKKALYDGIYVTAKSSGITISENLISDFKRDGIDVTQGSVVSNIQDNEMVDCRKYGIQMYSDGTVENISDNLIEGAGEDPININTANKSVCSVIKNNDISGKKGYCGIFLKSGNVQIESNKIAGTTTGVCIADKARGTVKADNKYEDVDRGVFVGGKKPYVASIGAVKIKNIKVTDGSRIYLKWKKAKHTEKYEVQYSSSSDFVDNLNTIAKNAKTRKLTTTKLKSGKTYYVRVRLYKTCNGVKVYGRYSKVKKITLN